jgi:hypothetical protein
LDFYEDMPFPRNGIKRQESQKGCPVNTRKTLKQKLHDELNRIEALHRHWNRLSMTERASIAKTCPDLSGFFRRGIKTSSGNDSVMAGSRLGGNKAQSN